MSVVVAAGQLEFDPSFDQFKDVFCNILEEICEAVRNLDKLESQLYLDWAGPFKKLRV